MSRSYLFIPGDKLGLVAKASAKTGHDRADALILDLEDAVAPGAKLAARQAVSDALAGGLPPNTVVRVNAGPSMLADIAALCAAGDPLICVPKADAATVQIAADAVERAGRRPRLLALVESAVGLREVDAVAQHAAVERLLIGEADLGAELGITRSADHAWWPIRMQLVVASALAGKPAPVGPISTDFTDIDGLAASTRRLRDAGFGARLAIHPAQLAVINQTFAASEEELARATRVVGAYEAALAEGRGVIVDEDGRMIDEAVVKVARRTLTMTPPGAQ